MGVTIHNLRLYHAFQEIEREAPDLAAAHARKQAALKKAKEGYRVAIAQTLGTLTRLWPLRDDPAPPWFGHAVAQLQDADALFLAECDRLHQKFAEEGRPDRHPLVRAVKARAVDLLAGCDALLIAGGHVGILRNRIAFFGIDSLLHTRPVIAWSGGAMVLADRILLYHDHTNFGVGTAEMLDRGFGMAPGVVYLPHARQRLSLGNSPSVGILARRLGPARAIALENGAWIEDGRVRSTREGLVSRLTDAGDVVNVGSDDAARS